MKKPILFCLMSLLIPFSVFSQEITLQTCQEKAKANYPLVKQYGLIEQTEKYNISNANKSYLPQLSLSAKATYQSDVTQIPAALTQILSNITHTNVSFPTLPKDQYQAVLEATQLIWDGGVTSAQKKISTNNALVDKQKLDVDLYALNDRVNQLFFGILLLNEQMQQNNILKNDLQTNYNKLDAMKANGVVQQADLDALRVEMLNADQRTSDITNTKKTYCLMLSALTGLNITDQTMLKKPEADLSVLNDTINRRPELALFDAQDKLLDSQKSLVVSGNLPKIGAFVQGGYGDPGLNMFSAGFTGFYIGGLRLSWNISGLYSQKNNLKKIDITKKNVDLQKETFLFNNNLITTQQRNEIEKLQTSIQNDDEIIRLRTEIKQATSAKLDNGAATVNDLIRDVNAENQSRQTKSLHEIQLLLNLYQLKNSVNN